MNKSHRQFLITLLLFSLVCVGYWLLSSLRSEETSELGVTLLKETSVAESKVNNKQVSPQAQAQPQKVSEKEFLSEDLINQISSFTDAYEQNSRYPVFSTPIINPESLDIAEPFEATKVDTPQFDKDGSLLPLGIVAAVNKYEYFLGEPITLRVEVTGLEENQTISAKANIKKSGGKTILPVPVELSPQEPGLNVGLWAATFETNSLASQSELGDLIVAVTVNIDGDSYFTTVPLQLHKLVSAKLENVGLVNVNGSFLNIPLEFSVQQSGYYFLQAYLYDQKTERPLLELQTEGRMISGNDSLALQAHYHAIKDAGSSGPYLLKVYKAFRSAQAEIGQENEAPVAISSANFFVEGFEFDQYSDQPYVDPETQRRIEALRELSARTQ